MSHFARAAKTADCELLMDIVDFLLKEGKTKEATKYLDMALKKFPNHPGPHLENARKLYNLSKDKLGALRELNAAELLAGPNLNTPN